MRKADVIAVIGSAASVANLLGISRSAISQWGDDVPDLRVFQLREKRPTIDDEIERLVGRSSGGPTNPQEATA